VPNSTTWTDAHDITHERTDEHTQHVANLPTDEHFATSQHLDMSRCWDVGMCCMCLSVRPWMMFL